MNPVHHTVKLGLTDYYSVEILLADWLMNNIENTALHLHMPFQTTPVLLMHLARPAFTCF